MVLKLLFSELLFQYAETCLVGVNFNLSENVASSHVCHAKSLGKNRLVTFVLHDEQKC